MIRVIVFAVVGLVLGLGGGSGFAVMNAKKAVVASEARSAKHDSTDSADSDKDKGEHKDEGEDRPTRDRDGSDRAGESSAQSVAAADPTPTPHTVPPNADTVAIAPSVVPHGPSLPTKPAASALPKTGVAATGASADSARAAASPVTGRISKIFGAMSAKEAARVLEQMDDADVQTVLGGLNDRQAAAILAGFPPARAAAISRAAIRGRKGAS